ncbi:MAG: replication-associated recombination protein A [Armatimonadetes bacterium]|nr:replication-associated recombination protein A [Armatimonadota bacterium]
MSLFEEPKIEERAPLAARMRPRSLDEFVGQEHLVGPESPIRRAAEEGALGSVILWGPAGCGKTTLARIFATYAGAHLEEASAVSCGVADVKKVAAAARHRAQATLLLLDEIHHFTRTQQDALLAFVEDGTLTLIGATTENPTFSLAAPLLSRCRVLVLKALADDDIRQILRRAARELKVAVTEDAEAHLTRWANGDARVALNGLELAAQLAHPATRIEPELVSQAMQRPMTRYDARGDQHYDIISAFIKSVRGSDVDAALHYLARMVLAGEDPRFIARRLVILASEDIGNAAPMGLLIATAAFHAVERIGWPEGQIVLAQATVFLAASPKSNSAYEGIGRALADLKQKPAPPVPDHLRDPRSKLYEERGVAPDSERTESLYPHEFGGWVAQNYLPEGHGLSLPYYVPIPSGYETKMKEFLESLGRAPGGREAD